MKEEAGGGERGEGDGEVGPNENLKNSPSFLRRQETSLCGVAMSELCLMRMGWYHVSIYVRTSVLSKKSHSFR